VSKCKECYGVSGTVLFHIVFAAFVVVILSVVWAAVVFEAGNRRPAPRRDIGSGQAGSRSPHEHRHEGSGAEEFWPQRDNEYVSAATRPAKPARRGAGDRR
jgi:hypothetical protein